MNIIVPTITAYTPEQYKEQLQLVGSLAGRVHTDFMDGDFAPTTSLQPAEMWWPSKLQVDLHIMARDPMQVVADVLNKRPSLTIIHHESLHASSFLYELHEHRLKVGVAILAHTSVDVLTHYLPIIDHVLIFSGHLGYHGGIADMTLLHKVAWLRAKRPDIEIGWDGGINETNITKLVDAGVNICNVGGYIHRSKDPRAAYEKLKELIQ